MIKHFLKIEPDESILFEQYAKALWLEQRQIDIIAAAISKALGE